MYVPISGVNHSMCARALFSEQQNTHYPDIGGEEKHDVATSLSGSFTGANLRS